MDSPGKAAIVAIAVLYLTVILLLPFANIFYQAFSKGVGPFFSHFTDPEFLYAVRMSMCTDESFTRTHCRSSSRLPWQPLPSP